MWHIDFQNSRFLFCQFYIVKLNYFIIYLSSFFFFHSIFFKISLRVIITVENDMKAVEIHECLKHLCETKRVSFWEQMACWAQSTKLCQLWSCHIWKHTMVLEDFLLSLLNWNLSRFLQLTVLTPHKMSQDFSQLFLSN